MQNTYQEKILDLENTNNSISKKLEGGIKFKIKSNFQPAGDQPQAIKKLISNLKGQKNEKSYLVLLALEKLSRWLKLLKHLIDQL